MRTGSGGQQIWNLPMLLRDVAALLDARPLCGVSKLDVPVENAGASDLMSDVLAYTRPGSVLLTGLCSVQVVRTAEMLDLTAIVFVRNKLPDDDTVALAEEMGLPLLTSPYPLYEACGVLFRAGLPGCLGDELPEDYWKRLDHRRSARPKAVGAPQAGQDA